MFSKGESFTCILIGYLKAVVGCLNASVYVTFDITRDELNSRTRLKSMSITGAGMLINAIEILDPVKNNFFSSSCWNFLKRVLCFERVHE